MQPEAYQWTRKDKLLYALSMIPFLTVFFGSLYLLATYSILLAVILVAIYLLINLFQAGCCVGCPYRGRYCPALGGVYLANLLSSILYRGREFDESFFRRSAAAAGIMVLLLLLFPLYWIARTGWYLVPIYLALIASHVLLFMPTQCEKCGYNQTCPGGQSWLACRNRLRAKR